MLPLLLMHIKPIVTLRPRCQDISVWYTMAAWHLCYDHKSPNDSQSQAMGM